MTIEYGKTWWGQAWLSALKGIDDSNRLPRGRRYAGNRSVREIEISATGVRARVQGSRVQPYAVEIALAAFTAKTRQRILQEVASRPALLSRLLNRQLPERVAQMLEDRRIHLFPRDWNDIRATCTCADLAMPCKHIAAVIYLLANEIDKNPFMVFRLHGMDLASQLSEKTGMRTGDLSDTPQFSGPWKQRRVFTAPDLTAGDFAQLDLSALPRLDNRILTILSPRPLFHAHDFRRTLEDHYLRSARLARSLDDHEGLIWNGVEHLQQLTTVIDDNGRLVERRSGGKSIFSRTADRLGKGQLETFFLQLLGLPASMESRLAPAIVMWRSLLRTSLKLVELGAFVPRVLANDAGETLIHWQPALLDENVAALFESLCALCPPDLVVLEDQDRLQRKPRYADARTQLLSALNLLLGYLTSQAYHASPDARRQDDIERMFFTGKPLAFDRFENVEHPRVIQHWLGRLALIERAQRLYLHIEERDEDALAVSLWVEASGQSADSQIPVDRWLTRTRASKKKYAVLADLAVLADHFPDVERLYETQDNDSELIYELRDFTPVFRDVLPALRMLGVQVMLPRALRDLARPRASLEISASGTDEGISYLKLDELLQFDWQVALGDQRVSATEFRKLVENASGIVKLKNQYVMVDGHEVQRVLDALDRQSETLNSARLLQAGLAGELDGAQVSLGRQAERLFEQLLHPQAPPPLPDDLMATLRPYQRRGYEWLAQNARLGFGSLLADDMGLGKTLQVIALLLYYRQTGKLEDAPALVVVPTSLITNWRKEIERFAPALNVHIYHGPDRDLPAARCHVLLTSYGLVRSDYRQLDDTIWPLLVIDEAQNIKNPATAQTKAIKGLTADIRIGLSGTPVENRLREYWSVFDFINPGYLQSQKKFAQNFANPIERDRDQGALDKFRRITAPFILRRLKTDTRIIADLPEKLEANRYCSLTARQASLYQSNVESIMQQLADMEEGIERRGLIFKLLNALKQICNSPDQFLNLDQATIQDSGKLAAFMDIMREAEASDEKVLIFTQYTAMGELLARALSEELNMQVPFLHGGRSRKQRDAMVDAFQNDRGVRAIILSLRAGGTGLNLTAASQVIHYDLWWNPAVEQQATDRAYRIGQQRNVMVHRLITENSFEEKIDAMIQSKKALAELTVTSGEQWITEMSDSQLRDLVSL